MGVATMRQSRWRGLTGAGERTNVSRVERWLSAAAGGALAAYGLKRRERPGGAAALAGAALLYRGATGHCPVYRAMGVSSAGNGMRLVTTADIESDTREQLGGLRGVHVDETVTIMRPPSEVYRFWRNLENLPQFMSHLESVAEREHGISHWVAKGPAGTSVEWDARIINDIEDRLIAWQSLEGSMVSTAGSVHFAPNGYGGTTVRVHFQYNPPAGKLGAAVAWLLGEEPHIQVREDLRRLKQILEGGTAGTSTDYLTAH